MKYDLDKYKGLRIYDFEIDKRKYEESTPTIWIDNYNLEISLQAIEELGVKHIQIQTFNIDFLNDERLLDLEGISIQHYIDNLTPFYNFNLDQLTHLNLPDGVKKEFDFELCSNLIFLGGSIPESYKNLDKLARLKYMRIFGYRKKNFQEIKNLTNLRKIEIWSMNCLNLKGLYTIIQKCTTIIIEKYTTRQLRL